MSDPCRNSTLELTINGTPLRDWTCPICGTKGEHGFCNKPPKRRLVDASKADAKVARKFRYSGKKGKKFWRKLRAIEDDADRARATELASELMATEQRVVQRIAKLLRNKR